MEEIFPLNFDTEFMLRCNPFSSPMVHSSNGAHYKNKSERNILETLSGKQLLAKYKNKVRTERFSCLHFALLSLSLSLSYSLRVRWKYRKSLSFSAMERVTGEGG